MPARQKALGLPVTADKNWIVVKPDAIQSAGRGGRPCRCAGESAFALVEQLQQPA